MKFKVVHIIGGLELGGAETLLFNISSDSSAASHRIFSLGPNDVHATRFRAAGRHVRTFGLRGEPLGGPIDRMRRYVRGLIELFFALRRESPDLVQTWMYQSDIVGGLLGKLFGKKVIWGIFNSNLSPENYSSRTNRIISACGVLAKWIPNTIVSCSDIGSSRHCEIGYPIEKIVFFPTGVDIDRFKMTNPGRRSFRATRGVHSYNFVIGMVARWDTQKDHRTLFRSVAKVTSERSDIELWLAGGYGIDESNDELMAMIREFGLDNQTKLFGSLSDKLIEFYSSLDLFVLSSVGEGVPNVLLEAMSVGLPCIASEVGDVKRVLADTGLIVPPENSERLALAINTILALPQTERESIGVRSRGRIRERYSKSRMMDSFTAIYKNAIET